MTVQPRTLHILTGPTAVGKTEWALRWAREHDAEIVSCDSLLFYRGMDIGTAKPTAAERALVPHHLIDILEVPQAMNVARYGELARKAVDEIASRGKAILVTGGSGFYLKSFFEAVSDEVEIPEAIKAEVAEIERTTGKIGLLNRLAPLNPDGLGTIDRDNPRRLARALERSLATGKSLIQLSVEFKALPRPYADWTINLTRLDRPAATLESRIDERAATMINAGLIGEVRSLIPKGLRDNPSASKAIGYREVLAMIDGRLSEQALPSEISKNTRALVKKQRTWFRTQLPDHRVLDPRLDAFETLFTPYR